MNGEKVLLFQSQSLAGRSEESARMAALSAGKKFRVVQRDGQRLLSTKDYDPERINVVVELGRVVQIQGEG